MGVLLHWQVQHRVSRVQVHQIRFAVGQPGHGYLPEDGGEPAGVTGLDSTSTVPVRVANLHPYLPHAAQVQVVLEQLAKQPSSFDVELTLQLAMVEQGAGVTVQPAQDGLETLTGPRETIRRLRRALVTHRPRRPRNAAMPASAARVSCALAASKRANAALTSVTSDSDRVSVLVRPPWVYVNAGLSCGSPAAQWQGGLPHLRRNVVRVPRSNQSLPRRGSVDIAHPLCRCVSLQRSPSQRNLELRDYASVRASRRRQTAQQDVPSEEPHPNDLDGNGGLADWLATSRQINTDTLL